MNLAKVVLVFTPEGTYECYRHKPRDLAYLTTILTPNNPRTVIYGTRSKPRSGEITHIWLRPPRDTDLDT